MFMKVGAASPQEGESITIYQENNVSSMPYMRGTPIATFIITKKESSGTYIIRLRANESLTLAISGTSVITKSIPENDSDVAIEDTFYINSYGEGYTIKPYSSNSYIASKADSSGLMVMGGRDGRIVWYLRGYRTYINSGVYAFSNNENTGMYMDTQQDSYESGMHAQQYAYSSVPTNSFSRGGLFKIEQLGNNTGEYTIRLMTNNFSTWTINDEGEVISVPISPIDSQISNDKKYYIVFDNNGFIFVPYNMNQKLITATPNSNASGSVGAPTSYLYITSRINATDSAKWTFIKYTGEDKGDVTLIAPYEMKEIGAVVENDYRLRLITWHTIPHLNRIQFDISYDTDFVCEKIFNDSVANEYKITIKNPGHFQCYVEWVILYNGIPVVLDSEVLEYPAIPKEGKYFIKNVGTQKYINIEGPSTNEGAFIHQWGFHTGTQAQWKIEHTNVAGYIRLKSPYSGLYIGVDSNNTSYIRQYVLQNDYTLWKIDQTSSNYFTFTNKATESSSVVAAIPLNANDNGTDLTQINYTDDDDYRDEWKFNYIGALHSVTLLGQPDSTTCWITSAKMFSTHYYPQTSQISIDSVNQRMIDNGKDYLGGYLFDVSDAINLFLDEVNQSQMNLVGREHYVFIDNILCSILEAGDVIHMSGTYVKMMDDGLYKNAYMGGHASLIVGYYIEDGVKKFVLNDPLPVSHGSYKIYTYDELIVHHYINDYYLAWDGYIVQASEYSNQSIASMLSPFYNQN